MWDRPVRWVRDFIEHGREGLLAHTTEDLVAALAWIACDRRMRGRIAAHNRTVAPSACSWPIILDRLRHCYAVAHQAPHASHWTGPVEKAVA
jgi:phosphatidylinositol alpha 1,6-mannosyltransferase